MTYEVELAIFGAFAGLLAPISIYLFKKIIEPVFQLRESISEILYSLTLYANIYSNPGTSARHQEVSDILRKHASTLLSKLYLIKSPNIASFFRLIPNKDSIQEASNLLIFISNAMFDLQFVTKIFESSEKLTKSLKGDTSSKQKTNSTTRTLGRDVRRKWYWLLIFALIAMLLSYNFAYQTVRNDVNRRTGDNTTDIKLLITPSHPEVMSLVLNITGGFNNYSDFSGYKNDLLLLYLWVDDNISYNYDGMYPRLPSYPFGSIDWNHDAWQYPSETIALGRGDCEDQAILLCSMFRCLTNGTRPAECIEISSNASGHVAVQLPFSDGKLVIFDPAYSYYSKNLEGDLTFYQANTTLNAFFNEMKADFSSDFYVSRVFSDYLDISFNSTDEYSNWMSNRTWINDNW